MPVKGRLCILFAVIVAANLCSCRKHSVLQPSSGTITLLDSVHIHSDGGSNSRVYKFFYDADGYVVKIHAYEISAFSYYLSTDSLVYDAAHKLQTMYTINVNGISQDDFLYDGQGQLTKVNFRPQQQSVSNYVLLTYYAGHKIAAMANYVNNTLDSEISYTYSPDGNLLTEADTGIVSRTSRHYTYDAYDNKSNFSQLLTGLNVFILPGELFPMAAANNILKKTYADSGKVYNYTYDYNNKGLPVKRTMNSTGLSKVTTEFFYVEAPIVLKK